ncbi:MAG: MarR family transcriptional regulator [Holophagaceae bacterium]|nr:MarR family transcriptional regulator [Holophagaceae bacterium]
MRRVLDALRWIVRDLRVASASHGLPLGLSAAQMFVLHVLQGEPGLSLGELADRTVTDQSSVSVVVRKLHEKRLVVKRTAKDDRRRIEVSLTPAGMRVAEGAPRPVQEALISRLSEMDPAERRHLRQLLERIAPVGAVGPPMFFDDLPNTTGSEKAHE